ncbi:MAG: DUF2059 domain-containing protein, partial [Pseudomonadota bacterium]
SDRAGEYGAHVGAGDYGAHVGAGDYGAHATEHSVAQPAMQAEGKASPPAIVIPPPAPIETTPAPPIPDGAAAPEHYDLYLAMEEGIDQTAATNAVVAAMRRAMAADPNLAMAEEMSPGLIEELANSARPSLKEHQIKVREIYLPRMAALFAQHLTPAEASEAAQFYRSDIGRRVLKLTSSNYSIDAMLGDAITAGQITQEQVDEDAKTTINNVTEQLTQAEILEIGQAALRSPAIMKLNRAQSDIRALRLQMENEPLEKETELAMQSAMEEIFARRFP